MGEKLSQQLSTPQSESTAEVCHICGDIGVADAIRICPKCKAYREHDYCRKTYNFNFSDDWCCDECEGEIMGSPHINKHQRGEEIITKRKVKCITTEEVIMLSSGSINGASPVKTTKQIHRQASPAKSMVISVALSGNKQTNSPIRRHESLEPHVPKEQAIRNEITHVAEPVARMTPSVAKDADSVKQTSIPREALTAHVPKKQSLRPMGSDMKAVQATKKELNKMDMSVSTVEIKDANSVKETSIPREALTAHVPEKQSLRPMGSDMKAVQATKKELNKMDMSVSTVETKDASLVKETVIPREALSAPSPDKQLLLANSSGQQVSGDLVLGVSDVENSNHMNIESKAEKYSRGPARDPSWKGWFEILDNAFSNVSSGFVARPCSSGLRIVYNCSRKMPQVLQLNLIQQKEVSRNLFEDVCPGVDDIALYFCPGENKRSDYDFILTSFEARDLAMKCCLSGVELYLFTSKILSAQDQKLNGEYFLWGVFRKIKKQKPVLEFYKKPPLSVHQPSDSSLNISIAPEPSKENDRNNDSCDMEMDVGHTSNDPSKENDINNEGDDYALDMEIDMIAGKDVGKIDVAVPKDFSCGPNPSVGNVKVLSLKEVKKEPCLDCPPGFERWKLNVNS